MPKFNVHIYRTYRLRFDGIEAETPQAAAEIASDMREDQAAAPPEDDEGGATGALVDTVGDTEFKESCSIDFLTPETALKSELIAALKMCLTTLEDEYPPAVFADYPAIAAAKEAIAKAETE